MFRTAAYWLVRLANPAAFVITIADGTARCSRGVAPAAWTADCAAIGAEFGIRHGHVEGVRRLWGLGLRFSPGIPPASHQRFRNVFATHLRKR